MGDGEETDLMPHCVFHLPRVISVSESVSFCNTSVIQVKRIAEFYFSICGNETLTQSILYMCICPGETSLQPHTFTCLRSA